MLSVKNFIVFIALKANILAFLILLDVVLGGVAL